MSDLMRNQFEEWQLQTYCGGSERIRKCKNDESYYYYTDVHLKWKAWQASRECMVVELPKPYVWDNDGGFERESDPNSECSMALIPKIDVMQSIHAAGVKTK